MANWAGRERDAPAGKRRAAPDLKVPGLNTAAVLLWRRSQAVQLPLVQAFPVLEVIVQVLHKIGEICESIPCVKHVGKEVVYEGNLGLWDATRVSVKHRHNHR